MIVLSSGDIDVLAGLKAIQNICRNRLSAIARIILADWHRHQPTPIFSWADRPDLSLIPILVSAANFSAQGNRFAGQRTGTRRLDVPNAVLNQAPPCSRRYAN
jgi:hypothetical protein